MWSQSFTEVETPLLTRSSPEVPLSSPPHLGSARTLRADGAGATRGLRAVAVSPAVQADPDGERRGALLPAGALLPQRERPQGPAAGVYAAGPRDGLRGRPAGGRTTVSSA